MSRASAAFILVSMLTTSASAFAADQTCPGTALLAPSVAPIISSSQPAQTNYAAFDCMMWQTFIYLNWPAKPDQRGMPDPAQSFGAPAPVVWETFKTVGEIFLPSGTEPGPWDVGVVAEDPTQSVRSLARGGTLRILTQESKTSEALAEPNNPNSPRHPGRKRTLLDDANQTDGSNLIDQNGQPVYYEMLMDQDEYNYVVRNKLYNTMSQSAFARHSGIELPMGATSYGNVGAIEVKAAWKVLGAGDDPRRFHTTKALVGHPRQRLLVGLVGLHIIQHASPLHQAIWATFAHVDNAPVANTITQRHYSFFDVSCPPASCPPNVATDEPKPTQVVQTRPIPAEVARINALMRKLIKRAAPDAPWRYYQLIDVQWPQSPVALPAPPQSAPLPMGSPSTQRLLNPVLETFLQAFPQKISCLTCHQMARTAESQDVPFAADYSFLLSHARGLPQQ